MQDIPSEGQILGGKYRVLRLLGKGGMGAVLEALHELTHKRVAIKWMHPHIACDPDAQARFLREAQASARVRHPHIVDVYDVVSDKDALFLVMELLEGEPLSALLERGGTPIYKLIALLLPAFRAVAAAHRQGVIHRDLKPDNIFLARHADIAEPVAKVLDFGISKVSALTSFTLTRTGTTLGTPMYMSLEQLVGDKSIDARADVYSLGVILYEAVTGRAPFEAETFSELAIKIATTEPTQPKQLRPDLPTPLARLVAWAMAKKREDRLESVEALIQELEPFASERSFRAQMTVPAVELPAVPGDSSMRQRASTPAPVVGDAQLEQPALGHSPSVPDARSPKPLWPRVLALLSVAAGLAAVVAASAGRVGQAPQLPVPPIVDASSIDAAGPALPAAAAADAAAALEEQARASPVRDQRSGSEAREQQIKPASLEPTPQPAHPKRPAKPEPPRAGRARVHDFL